jgi:hypothetical protein
VSVVDAVPQSEKGGPQVCRGRKAIGGYKV